jgi:hypothetical protein
VAGTPQQSKTSGRRRGSPFVLVFASAGGILVWGLYTIGVYFRLLCEETQIAEIGLFSGGVSPPADYSLGMGFPLASICFGYVAAERSS